MKKYRPGGGEQDWERRRKGEKKIKKKEMKTNFTLI